MAFDVVTFTASIAGSLIVSYVGVRYFTASRIAAERAVDAKRQLRETVGPWQASAQRYVDSGRGRPAREIGTAHAEDGSNAALVLRIAEALPAWRRTLVKRRCKRIFGSRWTNVAALELLERTADSPDAGMRITVRALFDQRDNPTDQDSYRAGLIHRVYSSSTAHEGPRLVRELRMLRQAL